MSVLSTEVLFAIMIAAECIALGRFHRDLQHADLPQDSLFTTPTK